MELYFQLLNDVPNFPENKAPIVWHFDSETHLKDQYLDRVPPKEVPKDAVVVLISNTLTGFAVRDNQVLPVFITLILSRGEDAGWRGSYGNWIYYHFQTDVDEPYLENFKWHYEGYLKGPDEADVAAIFFAEQMVSGEETALIFMLDEQDAQMQYYGTSIEQLNSLIHRLTGKVGA